MGEKYHKYLDRYGITTGKTYISPALSAFIDVSISFLLFHTTSLQLLVVYFILFHTHPR